MTSCLPSRRAPAFPSLSAESKGRRWLGQKSAAPNPPSGQLKRASETDCTVSAGRTTKTSTSGRRCGKPQEQARCVGRYLEVRRTVVCRAVPTDRGRITDRRSFDARIRGEPQSFFQRIVSRARRSRMPEGGSGDNKRSASAYGDTPKLLMSPWINSPQGLCCCAKSCACSSPSRLAPAMTSERGNETSGLRTCPPQTAGWSVPWCGRARYGKPWPPPEETSREVPRTRSLLVSRLSEESETAFARTPCAACCSPAGRTSPAAVAASQQ